MLEIRDPEIFRTVMDSLLTGVCLLDRERKILFWNEGAERITGHHRHEVMGHFCHENNLPQCDGQACVSCGATCPLTRALHEGKPTQLLMELRHKEGHQVPVRVCIVPIRNEHGSIFAIAESFDERGFTSEDDRRQHTLAAYGCLDETTNVPNRGFTQFHLKENLESFTQYHLPFGIMLVQVNQLEKFQATYGREAADAILRVIAHTLRNTLRPEDFVGRWGPSQFVAILMNSSGMQVQGAEQRIRRLVNCAGLKWWGDELHVTTTVSCATVQLGDTAESLLGRAQHLLEESSTKSAAAAVSGRSHP